ncbi:MAG: BrnT family toxin [Anaerolineaceae bacterium]|nr:MAG: BrnT family toxin [Anaerolineaceae bacterium]
MRITWDPKKAEINFKKQKVRFSDAELVLYDPFALTLEEQVVVVYSYRPDSIRLISAKKATPLQRKQYEKGN